jgi:hypothetical protein
MGCDDAYSRNPEVESKIAEHQFKRKQKAKIKRDRAIAKAEEIMAPLSWDKLPQDVLKPRVERYLARFQKIADILPMISEITLVDSKERTWEIRLGKSKGKIYSVFAIRDGYEGGTEEAVSMDINSSNEASVGYAFWGTRNSRYDNCGKGLVPVELLLEKFLAPLEKALGISALKKPKEQIEIWPGK